ncbi:MAG: MFS transporter [Alphaproteobacteria bacterium]
MPVLCGAAILTIGIGARQSFGIFQTPIAAELGVGREPWSFANALSMLLMGLFAPFVGNLADRFGAARTVAAGGVLYVAGMFVIALASDGTMLILGSILGGIGTAAAGFGPILGAINRKTPATYRSIALGVATAGGSFGQFAIVPFASVLQQRLDNWHATMAILGLVSVLSRSVQYRRLADMGLARRPPPEKDMLALLYALRAAAFVVFLTLPLSWASVLPFAAVLGFLRLGTVPLTGGLVGYDAMWWLSVGLGVLAALLHWQIRERPTPRLAMSQAQT